MRVTISDWKNEWKATFGLTSELEVVLKDTTKDENHREVYAGSFQDIPVEYLDRKVLSDSRVLESSIPERNNAYVLEF